MSARSFTRSGLVACALAIAIAACGRAKPPEADPADVAKLAHTLARNTPAPAGLRACELRELVGATLTHVTIAKLARDPITDVPHNADWANPAELDAPAARVLLDPHADPIDARRAAAVLLAAPSYVVYRLDIVDAPLALGMKSPKRGGMSGRAIRYDHDGLPTCMVVFSIRQDQARSDWAIQHSDRPLVDPDVAKALRDDLGEQYVLHAPRPEPAGSAK